MQINELKLKNFRNHVNKTFTFEPGLNLILGSNGAGKTNILEALFVIATGKSHKALYDKDLINYDHTFCSIYANVISEQEEYDLEFQVIARNADSKLSTKKVKVNKVAKSVSGFAGIFNSVIFSPEDIAIITGSPGERRRFLDLILSQTEKGYRKALNQYTKAVRQRNKILEMIRETGRGRDQLDFWNEQIQVLGKTVQQSRDNFMNYAKDNIDSMMKTLNSHDSDAQIEYMKNEITPAKLENYFEREVAAKSTLMGPHRDDFAITYNGKNIAEFGSRGQQRTLVLSLKLLEIGFIDKTKGERPVLLLDDIFSELDEYHRKTVKEIVNKQQTIITSAESANILDIHKSKIINL